MTRDLTQAAAERLMEPRGRRASAFGRHRWRLWVLCVELVVLAGVGVAWSWPVVVLRTVRYHGPAEWEGRARSAAAVFPGTNILAVDPKAVLTRLQQDFGAQAQVGVRLDLPGELTIDLVAVGAALRADGIPGSGPVAVAADGSFLPVSGDFHSLPAWRPQPNSERVPPPGQQARLAAGTWSEVAGADGRFGAITSEWSCDDTLGWTIAVADGRSRLAFGRTRLDLHAQQMAQLLEERDSLFAQPCWIDARFDGLLVVRQVGVVADTTAAVKDSTAAPAREQTTSRKPQLDKNNKTPRGGKTRLRASARKVA